jgi:hypothetical protein
VAVHEINNVSVLLGNGDGTFQSAVNYAIGKESYSVAIGKLNEDDDLDLTVANGHYSEPAGYVSVLINSGPAVDLLYTPVSPCRIVDTRKAGGVIDANTQRDFHSHGSVTTISAQGGNPAGCPAPMGEPFAVQINMAAVNPTGKGNLQAFAVGDNPGANFGINFAAIGTNFANAGIVETDLGLGPEITVASRNSSAHAVIDVLGYYYQYGDLLYTPVAPCRIVDTRNTPSGMIGGNTGRNFHVYGTSAIISAQGGNSAGCPALSGEPLAAHINMVAVNPSGKGNMQAFPVSGTKGANLIVNFADIGSNLANAGTIETSTGSGPDITVTSQGSSAHTVIDVLGFYYYPSNFAPVPKTGQTTCWDEHGEPINCEGTGQDGELQKGVPWPDPRFTDNADGTVTDNLTGLIWLRNADCFGGKD